jgi:hypothetical protein
MKKRKGAITALILFLVFVLALVLVYSAIAPAADSGEKTVTVEITHGDGTVNTFTIVTQEEYLRGALEQENLVSGPTTEYGLWIQTLDGETAEDTQEQWWGYTKSGEYVETGVDTTVLADGDTFEFTLNTGW